MLIHFEDQIWTRLYGPYGHFDVRPALARLKSDWDDTVATDLFWERLFHQETLYPVTYASLPYLWKIFEELGDTQSELLSFLTAVIPAATEPALRSRSSNTQQTFYNGLSLDRAAHHVEWLDPDLFLTHEDMEQLSALSEWFTEHAPEMSKACFQHIPNKAKWLDVYLCAPHCALFGFHSIGHALRWWNDGNPIDEILRHFELNEAELSFSYDLAQKLYSKRPDISDFLVELSNSQSGNSTVKTGFERSPELPFDE